jgi:hypothetical protein
MLVVSGCATFEDRWQDYATMCRQNGVSADSCWQSFSVSEAAREQRIQNANYQLSQQLQQYQNSLQQQQQQSFSRPVNCTSNTYFGTTYTNCN